MAADARLLGALLGLAVLAAGCGSEDVRGRPTPAPVGAEPTVALGQQPADYDARLRSSCGERDFLGTYDVTVRGDEVVAVAPVGRTRPYDRLEDVPTLADLAAEARDADEEQLAELVLDGDGVIRRITLDHAPSAIDDEECYDVLRLKVGAPAG